MTLSLEALVLPAFDDLEGLPGEAERWHDVYDLERRLRIPGVPAPLAHDGRVGVVPTGIGKAAAATTTTALCSSDQLDLSDALVCSVGVAGGPPTLALGSVVVSGTVVDWDDKCRLDGDLALNPYTGERSVFELDSSLVRAGRKHASNAELLAIEASERPGHGESTAADEPTVVGGVNVCGDELWHGHAVAEDVEWLLAERGFEPYRATEMEDAGTAFALERFDRLEQYLTVRAVSNWDRPVSDRPARESVFDPSFEAGFGIAIRNAVRAATRTIEGLR